MIWTNRRSGTYLSSMNPSRKLVLERELLTGLSTDDLLQVVAAGDVPTSPGHNNCLSLNPCALSQGITCTCTIRLCA